MVDFKYPKTGTSAAIHSPVDEKFAVVNQGYISENFNFHKF
ncbi:MAG: hypothetical protein QY308_02090 [Ignavibacteriaceae bacterium]|nr:MAG: hypothetical protein QY308_02090 [Ignavibacteriaceae bacterium]